MRVRYAHPSTDKVEQQMTPMIDIVFQLLAFFVMSFKLATVEGNFDIKMPLSTVSYATPRIDDLKVRLLLTPAGTQVTLNGQSLGVGDPGFKQLNARVRELVAQGGDYLDLAAALDCDYNVPYDHVIQAITAVSGYTTTINGEKQVVKLIEKFKFTQPRKTPGG